MSDRDDELSLHALGAGAIVAVYSLIFAAVCHDVVVDQFRKDHNLPPVLERGIIWDSYRAADVSLSDLGLAAILIKIILPAILFFVFFIVVARVVQSFCTLAEKFFQFAAQTDQQLMPHDNEVLVVRVAFWPVFFIYGVFLVCGSLTILLFKGIWR
jgi:hypothetical protein